MAVECSFPGCGYTIPEGTDPAIAAALLTTHALIHQTARAKPAPVKRPEISSGGMTEGWTYFLQRWKSYIQAVQLTDAEILVQLLECCDSKLRRDVTRNSIGPLPVAEYTKVDLLAAIRLLAVREENLKVARVALWEERVADQLCVGLADAEIQEDLLKHPDQSLSVEDPIKFVEVMFLGGVTVGQCGFLGGVTVGGSWGWHGVGLMLPCSGLVLIEGPGGAAACDRRW